MPSHVCRSWIVITAMAVLLPGCVVTGARRYTSQDLALLPCESGAAPRFFQPVEFDDNGRVAFDEQQKALERRLTSPVTDIVLFVHGWNKNPNLAEKDYQDFLCRMHGYFREALVKRGLPESEKGKLLLVVGVFWSSTLAPDGRDSPLLKPMSYFRMRKRADHISKTGLRELLEGVIEKHLNRNPNVRLHLVGHSFGGRMIVGALRELSNRDRLAKLVQPAAFVNAVLLNAAIAPGDLHWLVENVARVRGGRFSSASHSGLYNIHSLKDSANRYLFPLASMFSGDPVECAVGACGVPEFATLCLDESGRISTKRPNAESQPSQTDAMLAAWNVDATKVVFEHSDIYKGRVAHLVTELLFEDNRPTFAAVARPGPLPVAERCSANSGAREIRKNPSSGLGAG